VHFRFMIDSCSSTTNKTVGTIKWMCTDPIQKKIVFKDHFPAGISVPHER